jgi:hypothetical protein
VTHSATVDDVLAYGPCDRYPRERIVDLFCGRASVDAEFIFACPIPTIDKIHLICSLRWLSADQESEIKSALLALITDTESPHHERFQRIGTCYSYGPICEFLAETAGNGARPRDFADQCESLVFGMLREMNL